MHPLVSVNRAALDTLGTLDTRDPLATPVRDVPTTELRVWVAVLGVATPNPAATVYGLSVGLVERSPAARVALDTHVPAAPVAGTAVAFALAVRYLRPKSALLVPLALAGPWLLATGITLAVVRPA